MPSDAPPSYQTAVNTGPTRPNVAVTNPSGETRSASSDALNQQHGGPLERARSNESFASVSSIGDMGIPEEERLSMDDERRELPKGWVRCFDPKSEHHFYVDEATKRSTWLHPYDDPEYLQSLPDTHPAHPESKEAQAIRQHAQALEAMQKNKTSAKDGKIAPSDSHAGKDRNWLQRKKDDLIGTKEEREKKRADKQRAKEAERKRIQEAQAEYLKRRQELLKKQLNDPNIRNYYASDPYGYSAPAGPYSRAGGMYSSPFGYGYGGGYGMRGYGGYGGYGYGGGMGMGLPLMGGLAGGLLIGDMMGGGLGGGGFGC